MRWLSVRRPPAHLSVCPTTSRGTYLCWALRSVLNERRHVGQFLLAIDDIPAAYAIFDGDRGYCEQMCTEEELRSTATREEIIAYWEDVHRQTLDYLHRVTEANLTAPPQKTLYPDDGADRNIPRRDWLIKLIEHQGLLMGQLLAIKRLYENE